MCIAALQFLDEGIIFGAAGFCLLGLCLSLIGTLISMASFWLYIQERDGYFIRVVRTTRVSKDYNDFRSRMNKLDNMLRIEDLIVDHIYNDVICESFLEGSQVRVLTSLGQVVPSGINVKCSVAERNSHPIGTKFIADMRVCLRHGDQIFLEALKNDIFLLK